jgi:hypothetical protein
LLGADLERIEHQAKGGLACSYFIPEEEAPESSRHDGNP